MVRLKAPLLLLSTLLVAPLAVADAVKWVDEKGRVHFGDRPPDGHKGETEQVELKEAPKTGMTEAELAEQRKRVNNYKAELQRQKRLEELNNNGRPAASPPPTLPPRAPTREECRNMHPSKTADRVRCFQEAERPGNNT